MLGNTPLKETAGASRIEALDRISPLGARSGPTLVAFSRGSVLTFLNSMRTAATCTSPLC